jgi:plastocyanin
VVYLDRIPDEVEHKLTKTHWWKRKKPGVPRIVQADLRYSPRVLAAPVGTRVEFANLDRVFHNTFSVSAARRFDLGRYLPGHVDTVAFDRVGVANLHCDIHPQEVGFVVVVPNHAFTRPDSLGYFRLPKLPEGSYVVRVWHPRLGDLRREVVMPRRGNLQLDLKF